MQRYPDRNATAPFGIVKVPFFICFHFDSFYSYCSISCLYPGINKLFCCLAGLYQCLHFAEQIIRGEYTAGYRNWRNTSRFTPKNPRGDPFQWITALWLRADILTDILTDIFQPNGSHPAATYKLVQKS